MATVATAHLPGAGAMATETGLDPAPDTTWLQDTHDLRDGLSSVPAADFQQEGEPFYVAYDTQGTVAPGDDVISLSKTLSHADADATAVGDLLPAGTPLPPGLPTSGAIDFREAEVQHPVVRAATLLHDSLVTPLGLPAGARIDEDGVTPYVMPPLDTEPVWTGPISGTVPWPKQGYGLLPVGADRDRVGFTDHVDNSSDEVLQGFDEEVARHCGLALCPAPVAGPVADVAPEFVWFWQMAVWGASLEARPPAAASEGLGVAGRALAASEGLGGPGSFATDLVAPALALASPLLLLQPQDRASGASAPALSDGSHAPASTSGADVVEDVPGAAFAVAGLAVALLGMPLYRRIARGRVLQHEMRERILEAVRAQPGLHESELARRMGISHTLAQYHLRVLVDFGLVEVKRYGGRKCLFAAGQVGRTEKAVRVAERGRAAQLVDLIGAQPGMQQRDLARALGVRESTVKWHLDRLEAEGVVLVTRDAQGKRTALSEAAQQARLPAADALTVAPVGNPDEVPAVEHASGAVAGAPTDAAGTVPPAPTAARAADARMAASREQPASPAAAAPTPLAVAPRTSERQGASA